MNSEHNTCAFCRKETSVARQYLHAKNKPTTGDGFDYIYYCGECGLKETMKDNNITPTPKEWGKELKEIINHDWELMDLNPGKPYRNGMKEVHFIKLNALLIRQKQELVEEIKSFRGDLILEKTNCAERIDDYLSGQIQSCDEIIDLLENK